MKLAQVQSRCECQNHLIAEINEAGQVVAGWSRKGKNPSEVTPATCIGAGRPQFQVGWFCQECGRNTLRSFFRGALVFRETELPRPSEGRAVTATS